MRGTNGARGAQMISVVVVDPDVQRREGLAALAGRADRLEVVASVASLDEVPALRNGSVALVALPAGAWPGPSALPDVPSIVYSDRFTDVQMLRVLGGGAAGVLEMPVTPPELEHAVRGICTGTGTFIDPHLAGHLVAMAFPGPPGHAAATG